MPGLLTKVHKKMTIAAHRRVRAALEGEYASVFKGRSMDFDDLREYIPGDNVKDIDWKATARTSQILIKRFIAVRKYHIMIVADTGRSMAATAPSGECKRDIAVLAAGVIVSVAVKHNDLIALTAGDSERITSMPFKSSRGHAERLLQHINSISLDAPTSDLMAVLDYVRRTIKRKVLLIVISDSLQFAETQEQLLRRLASQHELMLVSINDVDPSDTKWNNKDIYDVEAPILLPTFIRKQKNLNNMYSEYLDQEWKKASHMLKSLRISNTQINSQDEVVGKMARLLEEHKHAGKRR